MDTRYSRRFVCGGNETATFSSVIAESTDAISGFYRELATECERWCGEHIASLEEYRERGCSAVRYCFEAREIRRGERELGIELKVYLCHASGRRELLFEEQHRWSLADGVMLLPHRRGKKGDKRDKALKKIKNIDKSS